MAERFYVNFHLTPGEVVLQGPEAHHLASVLRAKAGDSVTMFCNDGAEYPATVLGVARKSVTLSVAEPVKTSRELSFPLEVAAAIPKGDRGDILVEKLTELGVTRLVPLKTHRSVVHPRPERLQQTVIQASKQCGRNRLMEVTEVTEWKQFCKVATHTARRLLAHRASDAISVGKISDGAPTVIGVGPEGGFDDEEVALATAAGWQMVGLGLRTLRIETAAICLASYFSLRNA